MFSSLAVRARRAAGEMTRYLYQSMDTAFGRVGCQSVLDTRSVRSPVAHDDHAIICNDHDTSGTVASSGKDDAVLETLESEPNDAARPSRNTLPSDSACSAARCWLCQENDRPTCNCSMMNHRNHDPRRGSDAKTYSRLPRAPSTTERYFNRVFEFSFSRRRSSCRSISEFTLLYLICAFCMTLCIEASDRCALGVKTPGRTWPPGDIVLEFGQPLNIYCILNMTFVEEKYPGKNASDLVFFHDAKLMEREFITVINETTAMLHIQRPPASSNMYYCKLRLAEGYERYERYEPVCLNRAVIGFEPLEPENFTCISANWESITCSWDPMPNYIHTEFSLMFKLPGGKTGERSLYPCPTDKDKNKNKDKDKDKDKNENEPPLNHCYWDASTDPIYRQPYDQYTFILRGRNVLGNKTFLYKMEHYAHVIPARPLNLTVVNKTLDSALLYWALPFPIEIFPSGLSYRITYQNQWDHLKTWQVIDIKDNIHPAKKYYNLTNLQYANTIYDVRICIKSTVANENMWGNFSNITFRTPPRLPGLPPQTNIGSFEVTDNNVNRDVYLYWKAIPQIEENGDNFKYQIDYVEEDGRRVTLVPHEITRMYAKLKGLNFSSYQFEITATNVVGANKNRARIFVPSQNNMPQEPIAFTKVVFDNGVYELSWKPPIENDNMTNYTIFWCENNRDHPYQCTGDLDWIFVPKNITIYNITAPDISKMYMYQFAISANTREASSGMVWASCTVIHNKVIGKMKSVWINRIGSRFIEIGWKLHCSDRIGIVEGFKIYYCPLMSPYNLTCKEPKLNTTIWAGPHTIHGVINNLKPYTTYLVTIAVLTKNSEGLQSDPLLNTTLEDAPSTPPQQLRIVNVTNTTMFVTWSPPEAMNGVVRYYEVYYNGYVRKVDKPVDEKLDEGNYVELRNLLAYKNYSVSMTACTVLCSDRSPTIYQTTEIGAPGKINIPTVRFMNSSQVDVRWAAPQDTAGPLHYYEIIASDGEIQNSTKAEVRLPIPNCKIVGREHHYQFRIRAVNIAENNAHLKGPWSDPGEGNCYSDGPSFKVWVIIWVIGTLSGVAFLLSLAYASKRMWLKCRAMQDVEVKLPPGLAPNMKLLQKVSEQHIRQPSADSSGCSSGQESVTSSLTADSQVSSDSGTEVDPVPVSPDKLLETPPSWESSSLRQRNVGITRPDLDVQTAHWDTYAKNTKSGEPILSETISLARSTPNLTDSTGYTTSQHTWSSTGYISMPSSEELSNNPSPVPKENPNVTSAGVGGGYSVIGSVPKSDGDTGITGTVGDALIPIQSETKKPAKTYVTLASLEQKAKEKQQRTADTFRGLDELTFTEPSKCKKLDALASHFNTGSDKPYVQTGLIDTLQKPFTMIDPVRSNPTYSSFASKSLTDSCGKPLMSFASTPLVVSNALTETISSAKPYIAVSSIPEVTRSPTRAVDGKDYSLRKPCVQNCALTSSDSSSNRYVRASLLQRTLYLQRQRAKAESSVTEDEANSEDATQHAIHWQKIGSVNEKEPTSKLDTIMMTKQNTGYVTIAESPRLEQQRFVATPLPSSQEQFEKPPPPSPVTTIGQSTDEQYSKVTVVPSTIQ